MSGKALKGSCHCGGVNFTVELLEGLEKPRRCDCTYCRMRGAVVVSALTHKLTILSGADLLKTYRFNSMQAEHHFCSNCGIYTHHKRRSNPSQLSVNIACIEGLSPFDFRHVPVYDGQTHHNDRPGGPSYRIAGYLDYSDAV